MLFLALVLGTFGLAGFTVGGAVIKNEASTSSSYEVPSTSLTHWLPSKPPPTASLLYRRGEPSLTLPPGRPCSSGSTTIIESLQTSVCTIEATAHPDNRPCAMSWYAWYGCRTTATASTSNDMGGRLVVRYAKFMLTTTTSRDFKCTPTIVGRHFTYVKHYTLSQSSTNHCTIPEFTARPTQDLEGYSQRCVANFAARSTQDFGGGCSQRAVARFAEPTATVATPTVPICSFDREQGEYICHTTWPAIAIPTCSFDPMKDEYVCNEAKIASATHTGSKVLGARLCHPGIEMCAYSISETRTTSDDISFSTAFPEWTATVPVSVMTTITPKITANRPAAAEHIPPSKFFSTCCPSGMVGTGCTDVVIMPVPAETAEYVVSPSYSSTSAEMRRMKTIRKA